MKMNKKYFGYSGNRVDGFTIIETLISLLLVTLVMLSTALYIVYALDGYKKSNLRFMMTQEIESRKNQLFSKPFDSPELNDGSYSEDASLISSTWDIKSLTPSLKSIHLSVSIKSKYGTFKKKIDFYKSKYIKSIKEVVHD
jgi:Tfp pilus assembly protein PilV